MEFVWDAIKDSLILLPFLFIAYVIIEVIEYFSASKIEHSKLLAGKYSTLFGASFGLIPQCGFSVVATDLYASKKLKIGTLIAVYIATSDEAIPLLLTSPNKILSLLPLLLIKFVLALAVGYIVDAIFSGFNKKRLATSESAKELPLNADTHQITEEQVSDEEEHHDHEEHHHKGCCGHEIEEDGQKPSKKALAKRFLLHPLVHTLKIFAFILVINLAFGGLVELITEERLVSFLTSSKAFAPLIACVVGLIPNCASSVIITKLFTLGGIGFGACMAGLIVNAGIAFVVLFKENKNLKQNFAILGTMFTLGIAVGYIIQLIGF